MTELRDLFRKRKRAYLIQTEEILKQMLHVLHAVVEYLDIKHEVDNGNLAWEEVILLEDEDSSDEERIIILAGVISYKPGDTVVLEETGEEITITEGNADYYRRIVKIDFPYTLATEGSKEDVIEFLEENIANPEEINDVLQQLMSEEYESYEEHPSSDFNLDELTDDQRQALELFNKTQGGKAS